MYLKRSKCTKSEHSEKFVDTLQLALLPLGEIFSSASFVLASASLVFCFILFCSWKNEINIHAETEISEFLIFCSIQKSGGFLSCQLICTGQSAQIGRMAGAG